MSDVRVDLTDWTLLLGWGPPARGGGKGHRQSITLELTTESRKLLTPFFHASASQRGAWNCHIGLHDNT